MLGVRISSFVGSAVCRNWGIGEGHVDLPVSASGSSTELHSSRWTASSCLSDGGSNLARRLNQAGWNAEQ